MTNTGKPKRKKALLLGGIALVLVIGIVFLLWIKPWVQPDMIFDWSTPPAGDRKITTVLSASGHVTMAYEVPYKYDDAAMKVVPYTCFIRLDIDAKMEMYNYGTDEEYDNVVINKWVAELYEWDDPQQLIKKVDVQRVLKQQLPDYQPLSYSVSRGIYEGEASIAMTAQPVYNGVPYLQRPSELRNIYTSLGKDGSELPVVVVKLESEEAVLLPHGTELSLDVDLGVPEQDYSILELLKKEQYTEEKGIPHIFPYGENTRQYAMLGISSLSTSKAQWENQGLPIYNIFPELYDLANQKIDNVYFLFDSTVTPEEIVQLFIPQGLSWEPEGDYDY